MPQLELKTYSSYNRNEAIDIFDAAGFEIRLVRAEYAGLVVAEMGAALECIDGRNGNRDRIKKHGPKIPGGLNAIAAVRTGGDTIGFNDAAKEVARLGYRAGTHIDCGFFGLWRDGRLESTNHVLVLPENNIERLGNKLSRWINLKNRLWGGNHFFLPGEHEEEALVFNPFIHTTIIARSDRFGYDHWFMQSLGIHSRRAIHLVAETVDKLAPQHKIVEFLVS